MYSEPGGQRLVPEPGLHRHCGPPEELRTAGLPEQPGPAEEPPPAAAHRVTTPPTPSALRLPSTSLFCASPTEASVPDPSLSLSHLLDGWKLRPLDVSERFGCRLELTLLCGRGRGEDPGRDVVAPGTLRKDSEVRRSSSVFKPACLICLTTCLSASAY